uniref:Glyco_18 domain-containing protein n=1 Tax=Caenorhabditis tropicalis TaxID=1561998 RepID=A0A1I7UWM3_9PELO
MELQTFIDSNRRLLPRTETNVTPQRNSFKSFLAGFLMSTILAFLSFGCSTVFFFDAPNKNCTTPPPQPICQKRIVGYYSAWEYREFTEQQLSRKLTHLVFAFVGINISTGRLTFENDGKETLFWGMMKKAKQAQIKVMISTDWFTQWTPNLYGNKTEAERSLIFIENVIEMMRTYRIDGVDFNFDWNKNQKDKMKDVILMKEPRKRLLMDSQMTRRSPYLPSMMVPSTDLSSDDEIYLNALMGYVDFVNVHSMNFHKYWKVGLGTFPGAPLTLKTGIHKESIDSKMKYLSCLNQSPSKLNIGINFFEWCWWDKAKRLLVPWRGKHTIGSKPKIVAFTENTTLEYDGKTFYTLFEDEESIGTKMKYAMDKNIGGVVIWRLEFDDDQMTLLNAVASDKYCFSGENQVKFDCFQ